MRRDGNRSAEKLKSEIAVEEHFRISVLLANGEFSEIPVHHLPMRST